MFVLFCFVLFVCFPDFLFPAEEKNNQLGTAPLMLEKEENEKKNNGKEKEERAEDIEKLVAKLEGEVQKTKNEVEEEEKEEKEEVKEEGGEGEEEKAGEKNEEGEKKKGGEEKAGEHETRQHVRYHLTPDDVFDKDNRKNVLGKRRSAGFVFFSFTLIFFFSFFFALLPSLFLSLFHRFLSFPLSKKK